MSNRKHNNDRDYAYFEASINDEVLHEVRSLAIAFPKDRLKRFEVSGQFYWLKRTDRPKFYPLGKLIHGLCSPILYPAVFKSSPLRSAKTRAQDEVAKAQAFRSAGIAVPNMALAETTILALQDIGQTLHEKMQGLVAKQDLQAKDILLNKVMVSVGHLHSKGLVHGRPHLRDMFEDENGDIGFFDFEEIPEKAMPFLDAAARDLWLIAFHVAQYASTPEAGQHALRLWATAVPPEIPKRVAFYCRKIDGVMKIVKRVAAIKSGRDLRQFIAAYDLLKQSVENDPINW